MQRKLTITVDEDVYAGLHRTIGRRRICRFLNDLARPLVTSPGLEAAYREMAADEDREREAAAWSEGVIGDVADEPRSLEQAIRVQLALF
ncbi:MAG: hypothetical protein U1E38_05415 [Rhodospirillales bacterium]